MSLTWKLRHLGIMSSQSSMHDEDATNIEFDAVAPLLGLEEIEGGAIIRRLLMAKGNKIKHGIPLERRQESG